MANFYESTNSRALEFFYCIGSLQRYKKWQILYAKIKFRILFDSIHHISERLYIVYVVWWEADQKFPYSSTKLIDIIRYMIYMLMMWKDFTIYVAVRFWCRVCVFIKGKQYIAARDKHINLYGCSMRYICALSNYRTRHTAHTNIFIILHTHLINKLYTRVHLYLNVALKHFF